MKNTKPPYETILAQLDIYDCLSPFQPTIIGTPPLGIHTENSDIDLICHYKAEQFEQLKMSMCRFQHLQNWFFHAWADDNHVYICRFSFQKWDIEIFCSTQAIEEQYGYRHFQLEKRLLELADPQFMALIRQLKQLGIKTEPAFAQALNLSGNPYTILNQLFDATDLELKILLNKNVFYRFKD